MSYYEKILLVARCFHINGARSHALRYLATLGDAFYFVQHAFNESYRRARMHGEWDNHALITALFIHLTPLPVQ